MINVLGLDIRIFDQVPALERAAYKTASTAFLVVIGVALLADGFMGWMLYGSWYLAIGFALFFAFIQFSILRIALITLLSKPLIESKTESPLTPAVEPTPTSKAKALFQNLKSASASIRVASVFRIIFVGLIAFTIAFPFGSFMLFPKAMEIERTHRQELIHSIQNNPIALNEIQNTHFPFHIFKQLLNESSFKFFLAMVVGLVYLPLFLVARLRFNKTFEYLERARKEMINQVVIDYDETLEQCQFELNASFPNHSKNLKDLSVYEDAPINSVYKNKTNYKIGTKSAFNQYLQSL